MKYFRGERSLVSFSSPSVCWISHPQIFSPLVGNDQVVITGWLTHWQKLTKKYPPCSDLLYLTHWIQSSLVCNSPLVALASTHVPTIEHFVFCLITVFPKHLPHLLGNQRWVLERIKAMNPETIPAPHTALAYTTFPQLIKHQSCRPSHNFFLGGEKWSSNLLGSF